MGASSSSYLDETKANYIRGRAEGELRNFSPHYRLQYCQAQLQQLQEEVEPRRERRGQLLTQKEPKGAEEVLYQDSVNYHDDSRKWRERFVVVRGNHTVEIHDSQESCGKGLAARHTLSPAGGALLISEDAYTALVDKTFPDPNGVKEEPPAQSVVPAGWIPVFLRLPYSPDTFFCFRQEDRRDHFLSVLNTCIRHQNLGWSRGPRCEALALQRALLLYRQEKGHYESWDLQLGSDLQVLSNLVMEELLPSLQTELLPKLRGKKAERRRVWMSVVHAAYGLVQEQLRAGLATLKEECRQTALTNQAQIRSNLDQILASRTFLQDKLTECVCVPAERFCSERVVPCLAALRDELMGGASGGVGGGVSGGVGGGFLGLRRHLEAGMTSACLTLGTEPGQVSKALAPMRCASLEECYQTVEGLQERCLELRQRFRYSNARNLIHSTQIDMQQLMENAVHTFEQLVQSAVAEQSAQLGSSVENAKLRVLKLYDHDSIVTRRRILQEALVDVTLPALRRNLAPTCKPDLQRFEQFIFSDYSSFIQVENVYEDILLNILTKEINKVVLEAADERKIQLQDGSDQTANHSSLSHLTDPNLNPDPDPNLNPDPNSNPNPDPVSSPASPKSEHSSEPNPSPDTSLDPSLDPSPASPESEEPLVSPLASPEGEVSSNPNPDPNPDPNLNLNPDPNPDPNLNPDPNSDPNLNPASLGSGVSPLSPPTSPPASHTEFPPDPEAPAASISVSLGCEVIPAGCEVIPAGCEVIHTVTDSLASLCAAALPNPPAGHRLATDRAVYLNPPTAQPETQLSGTVQSDTPVEDSGMVQDDNPVAACGTVQSDTLVEVIGTVQENAHVEDSGTIQDDTPVAVSSGTVQDDTLVEAACGTTQDNSPGEGNGTVQVDAAVQASGTVQSDTTVEAGSGMVKTDTPVGGSEMVQDGVEGPVEGEGTAEGEEPELPVDSVKQIRDLVVEVIEVEDLVYRCPRGNGTA